MRKTILTHIAKTEEAIKWVSSSLSGDKQSSALRALKRLRRELKKRDYALSENPAAAMYGESQKGKSYLVSGLLSVAGETFSVKDAYGNTYDFINQINPVGHGTESTSLVTRFSTDYRWLLPEFPVKAKLLSPSDLALALCDSYYNDLKINRDASLRREQVEARLTAFETQFATRNTVQTVLTEDNVLDMQDYFDKHIFANTSDLKDALYFEKIAKLIPHISSSDWCTVFSVLWNENRPLTTLYANLITQLEVLNFDTAVYLPIDAVLRDNGTLLDVTRLKEIYEPEATQYQRNTTVCKESDNTIVQSFPKPYLCALIAELVFRLPDELIQSKPFLENNDLLDFPGARHRLGIHEADIEDDVIHNLLLRGKVSFLFNNYSDNYLINTLLFCHDQEQSAQSAMPDTLNQWIGNMIGDTPAKRATFCSSVPPLFVIATKFNIDLKFEQEDGPGKWEALNDRWNRRFIRVLENEIFAVSINDWLNNWTPTTPYFQNIYLLRDYHYSKEGQSNIFRGYPPSEKEEIKPASYPDFRLDLRRSFIEFDFVQQHFADPSLSWDSAATLNHDGSQLIIDRLTTASESINSTRNKQFRAALVTLREELLDELKKYYHNNDSADRLLKACRTAGRIQLHLDGAIKNPCFFGNMMKLFNVSQGSIYQLFHDTVHNMEKHERGVNMSIYIGYLDSNPELNPNNDFKTNLEILRKKYEKTTLEQCQADFEAEGIDLNELFYGSRDRIKNSSQLLAETLESYWFDVCLKYEAFQTVFSETDFIDVKTMLYSLYHNKLNVSNRIAQKIRRYIDSFYDRIEAVEIIADISAEMLNNFINTVGYCYISSSDIEDLYKANEQHKLGMCLEHNETPIEQFDETQVVELFSLTDRLPDYLREGSTTDVLRKLPLYRNFRHWYDMLKVGFIMVNDIPDFDPNANAKLGELLNDCITVNY
jgi:hypothetical protein